MKVPKKISVFGLGKLGACIAATLAMKGFEVIGIDIDNKKVEAINKGQSPVEEPLLADTIKKAGKKLRASTHVEDALKTDISFFIPPSHSLPDGTFSNEHLLRAMSSLARLIGEGDKKGHIFVCSSTVTPGASQSVLIPAIEKEIGGICGEDFSYCYNPEFIALGNVIKGLLEPDLVLIGESDKKSGDILEEIYKKYNDNKPRISRMSIVSAEITKIALNSYITMKISYTNQMRMIADQFPEANIFDILEAVGADMRVGHQYLKPGLSYGGPCFPRDNRMLAAVARKFGMEAPLAEAAHVINERTHSHLFNQVIPHIKNKDDRTAILGISYKPDTYIVEEAAGLILAKNLKTHGYQVILHDFNAHPLKTSELREFEFLEDLEGLRNRSDIKLAVICCPWPTYDQFDFPSNIKVLNFWHRT